MDREWLDELGGQVSALRVCWSLAHDVDPEDSAATLKAVADRLRWLAREARRATLDDAAA